MSMRRVQLAAGERFDGSYLNRTGAFNAGALIAATKIVEDVRGRGDEALRVISHAVTQLRRVEAKAQDGEKTT